MGERQEEQPRERRGDIKEPKAFGVALRARVDRALQERHAPKGTLAARAEERLMRYAGRLWSELKEHPAIGVILSGTLGLALAMATGAAELIVAISAAYAAYLVLREHVAPAEAVVETFVPHEKHSRGAS
jgi:hypothetical protein